MTDANGGSRHLRWKTLIKRRTGVTQGIPAGKEALSWVANSVTLIYGERDACLVDTFLTTAHAKELVDWVAAEGKNLTTIYITHAHGDHFFGLQALLDRFPKARAIATPDVVRIMKQQISPEYVESFWEKRFPGQLPDKLAAAEAMEGNQFELEGHKLVAAEIGHTDTDNTTCLHVPSISLVVAGDAVYNGTHLYLAESSRRTRPEWLGALDKIAALRPRSVIAGHKSPDADDDPRHVEETRKYIQDFIGLNEVTRTARELYDRMLEHYPDRLNPGALWASANTAKGNSLS
jgi:glyoxylase-like metal-dependent hydrolase (beta-lactamase superfamily II)